MTARETALALAGCELLPLDAEACDRFLAWLLGEPDAAAPKSAPGPTWVLAHSDDGVTWGRYDAVANAWRLGNQVAPEISPAIRRQSLQELRVFGKPSEVLIWSTPEGLRGRLLEDTGPDGPPDQTDPLRPSDEFRIVRGERIHGGAARGFTRVSDATGAEQVLPVAVDEAQLRQHKLRLHVRHYWAQNTDDGTVRIAVTRLVKLTTGDRDAG